MDEDPMDRGDELDLKAEFYGDLEDLGIDPAEWENTNDVWFPDEVVMLSQEELKMLKS